MCRPHPYSSDESSVVAEVTSHPRWRSRILAQVKSLRELRFRDIIRSNKKRVKEQLNTMKSWRLIAKVHKATVWVVNINFSLAVLPLIFLLFLRILSPHTELQVTVGACLVVLHLAYCCLTNNNWMSQDGASPYITRNVLYKYFKGTRCPTRSTPPVKIKPTSIIMKTYERLPLKILSRLWGVAADTQLPFPLSVLSVWLYSSATNCDRSEAEYSSLLEYKTIGQFFTRKLKPGMRPICPDSSVVSPADGTVTYRGVLLGPWLQQIKGVTYNMRQFLGPLETANQYTTDKLAPTLLTSQLSTRQLSWTSQMSSEQDTIEHAQEKTCHTCKNCDEEVPPNPCDTEILSHNSQKLSKCSLSNSTDDCRLLLTQSSGTMLFQSVVYLSPGDYHRFHSPTSWTVRKRRHFPGKLYSVSPSIVKKIPGLFHTNERVAFLGRWKHGFFALVAIGATNVGSIHVNFDNDLLTNAGKLEYSEKEYKEDVHIEKGEEFGHFSFGSSIVLLYEAPHDMEFKIESMSRIKVGHGMM